MTPRVETENRYIDELHHLLHLFYFFFFFLWFVLFLLLCLLLISPFEYLPYVGQGAVQPRSLPFFSQTWLFTMLTRVAALITTTLKNAAHI